MANKMKIIKTQIVDNALISGVTAVLTIENTLRGKVVDPGPAVK
jgi:hypothetical protein